MVTPKLPHPSLRTLLASWWALTGYVIQAIAAKMDGQREDTADAVGRAIRDLDWDTRNQAPQALPQALGLPPLCPQQFVDALRPKVDLTLRRVAEVMNEDPSGYWEDVTEERVEALLLDLGEAALEQGVEMRVAAAEAQSSSDQSGPQRWARRYRCMLALEGRWPPVPETNRADNLPLSP
jgi:hypothetical protein